MTNNGAGVMPIRNLLATVVLFNLCFAGGLYANLALNPGFELGSNSPWDESKLPDNWWKWQSGSGLWAAWKNNASSVGASGANYVNTGASTSGSFVRWGQNINITVGNYYTLSVDAAAENWGNPNGALLIEWKTSSDTRIGNIQRLELFNGIIKPTWSRYSFTKQAPAGAAKAAFMLEGAYNGTIMYDNVAVAQDADFNNDSRVNMPDFATMANKWRQTDSNLDLSGDNFIGMADLALFVEQWLNYYEPADEGLSLTVNDSISYQQIDGFGASLTDSSAYLLYYSLTAQQRLDVLTELFDSDSGIGLNYLRQPMGTSDMRRRADYTYDDIPPSMPNDYALSFFTIASDQTYIIPVLL
jgi:hypothetical protein